MAEIIRRAPDAYLAWDDLAYSPVPKSQTRNAHSSPTIIRTGLSELVAVRDVEELTLERRGKKYRVS